MYYEKDRHFYFHFGKRTAVRDALPSNVRIRPPGALPTAHLRAKQDHIFKFPPRQTLLK